LTRETGGLETVGGRTSMPPARRGVTSGPPSQLARASATVPSAKPNAATDPSWLHAAAATGTSKRHPPPNSSISGGWIFMADPSRPVSGDQDRASLDLAVMQVVQCPVCIGQPVLACG